MLQNFIFISVLIIGYFFVGFIFRRFQSRLFMPSGIEYIFLGILIGPAFSNWFSQTFSIDFPNIINVYVYPQFSIVVTLVIGLAGLIYGLNFNFSEIRKTSKESFYISVSEILLGFIFAGIPAYIIFFYAYYDGFNFNEIITAAYVLSLAASISSVFIIKSLISKYHINGELSNQIKQSTSLNINLVILIYGIIFGLLKTGSIMQINISATEWVLIGIGLIFLIGFLFFVFLEKDFNEMKIIIAVAGMIIFTSGVSYSLEFSSLYMNFLLGLIISNSSKISGLIKNSMQKILHPLSVLVIIFAGYFWMPADFLTFIISAIVFILLRFLVKFFAGKVAFFMNIENQKMEPGIGKGLLPMEMILAAMIIDYINVYPGMISRILVSAVFSGMIFYGIIGYNSVKKFLIDAGELKEEIE